MNPGIRLMRLEAAQAIDQGLVAASDGVTAKSPKRQRSGLQSSIWRKGHLAFCAALEWQVPIQVAVSSAATKGKAQIIG